MSSQNKSDGTAVWYFVAAVFAAVIPVVLPTPGPGHWTTLAGIGLAVLLLILGGIVLGMEMSSRRRSAD